MKILLAILIVLITYNLFAADYYWAANSGNNWNTVANWTDGGGIPLGSTPGNADIVHFTNSDNTNCIVDINVNIGGLVVDGYTGTLNINGYSFQVTSGNCTFNTGIITGGTLTINTTGTVTFAGTSFGAIVNSKSARVYLNGSTFNAVATIEKTGADNDNSNGGNTFAANTTITNSGSGYMRLENGNADTFSADLTLINSGSSYLLFATNSAGNIISGNLIATNSGNGNSYTQISYNAASTVVVSGNVTINNTGSGSQTRNYLCVRGTVNVGGDLTLNNNATATTARMYLCYYNNSQITVSGNTTISNNGNTTNNQIYVGYQGDIIFNGTVTITNNSSAGNSRIYCNLGNNSNVSYNENIIVESINASCDGISFGENGGSGTLAATKTITIGGGGFIAGDLEFRNFTQTGNTAQSLTCTGTARIYNYDSNWGGNINFVAPRQLVRGTTFNGTSYIEKMGANNDSWNGGNTFVGNSTIKNNGSGYIAIGNGIADIFNSDAIIINNGTSRIYFEWNGAGGSVGGNLTLTNTGTGTNIDVCSNSTTTLDISGNTTITNTSTANTANITFGNNGIISCSGNITVTNNGAGTTKRIYIGNNADITIDGDLVITNNSSASNSQIYCNYGINSTNTYNGNIIVESTDANCDGIIFGGNGGSGTLAATKTITIGGGGFVAGDLEFRNFTQTGNTAHNLTCTGTARIYNYDSNWGGDVNFVAPRILTRGTTYNRTAYLEKTGASDDGSAGGNDFKMDVELKNTGSGYFLMGNGSPDTCRANLTINNEGTSRMYFAHNSADNYIAGNLVVNNTTSGNNTYVTFTSYAASTLIIDGTTTLNNNSTATTGYIDFGDHGTTVCNGNVTVSNNGSGTTKQVILGNYGNITFNGTLNISNNSDASNSQIYLNRRTGYSNQYNNNIVVECTNASCDGIIFGGNGGSGTLAATKTITIGGGGFIAGDLEFRNFTQTGNTAHNLTCTGTARIYNYDSNWGGDVNFVAPRILTRGTTYNRTAYLEKTGASNDASAGGNTFKMDVEFVDSGSGYFMLGNGTFDDYQANVTLLNTGSSILYFARSGAGHSIAGDFTVNNNSTETNSYIYIADLSSSNLIVNGNTTITNNGGNTTKRIYVGVNGDITFNGTLSITNNSDATNSQIYCNYGVNSTNTYNENITAESTNANSDGILFGSSNGRGTLAATKTITIGGGGFVAGDLEFRNFTQTGNTAHNLTCTGTARIYNYDSNWGGNVSFVSPQIITRGTTYNGTAYLEKTGATDNASAGGNDFKQDVELKNSGSRYFLMGNGYPDTCRANLTLNNTGSQHMYFAHNSAGNYVAGNITINNTTSSATTYIYISTNSASTLNIDGNCAINNSGASTTCRTYLGYNGDVTIGGNLDVVNQGSNTTATVTLGNNTASLVTINGNTSLINNGGNTTKQIIVGSNGDVVFNGTLDISNNSSATNSQIYLNYDDNSSNIYNENITVECTDASCDGVLFGHSNGVGTLANGKTITIGSNGFISGDLQFRNFTQTGNTAQSLTCTGTTRIYNYNSNWGGNIIFTSPRILTRGTTYNGTAFLEKTGSGNNYSAGLNTFEANTTIKNSGTGRFYMGNGNPDDYNADVTFIKTNSGGLYPAYNAASTYAGDINFNSNGQIYLGNNTNGRVIFDGTTAQAINNLGSAQTFIFRDLQTNNPNDEIALNTPVEVSVELDLDAGNIITSSTNLLTMRDNATVSSVSDNAYVDGPVEKIGNDAFTFPVGNGGYYAPVSISAPSNTTHRFKAQYFHQDPDNAGDRNSLDATLNHISYAEYWTLDRTNGNSNVNVSLSWNDPRSEGVTNLSDLSMTHWNGTIWQDYGNDATSGNTTSGTITVNSVSSFSPFTLASTTAQNPLPVELISFSAMPDNKYVDLNWATSSEINNDYFIVQRSKDGVDFEDVGKVKGAGTSNQRNDYSFIDYSPIIGTSYYRLKQVDFDGQYKYSNIAKVNIKNKENITIDNVNVYPNPVNQGQTINVIYNNDISNLVDIRMFSIQGGEVYFDYSINANKIEIKPINISKGIYFMRINNDYNVITKKVIIR